MNRFISFLLLLFVGVSAAMAQGSVRGKVKDKKNDESLGFVNVVESKELLMRTSAEHIVACGRKGGSNVAAAIVNALLYLASGDRRS